MVITMLEANVEKAKASRLVDSFSAGGHALPPIIRETFLLHDPASDLWRIVTVWESKQALDGYRASVDTPAGVLMFRSADAEPSLSVFEVAAHATHS